LEKGEYKGDFIIFDVVLVLRRIQPYPLCLAFPDAPCVVGDLCFLQLCSTYGAFDCAERLFLFPKQMFVVIGNNITLRIIILKQLINWNGIIVCR
jgi:hypothetical protein